MGKTVDSVEVQDLIDRSSVEFKRAIQFCYRVALRSFLTHNGYNNLPKTDLQYVSQAWHRGYKRHEVQALLSHLRKKHHKLFVMMAAESGLRSHILMDLQYRHVMEDFESGTIPVAVRLEPRFHVGKKAAGNTFLGEGSIKLLRDCIEEGVVEARLDARLIPRSYYGYGQLFIARIERQDWTLRSRPATVSVNISRTRLTMQISIMRRR